MTRPLLVGVALLLAVAGLASALLACVIANNDATDCEGDRI